MSRPSFRSLKWLLLPAVVAVAIYWMRFAPAAGIIHSVALSDVTGETMGTGTLEARYAASISPKITGRLTAVKVDQGDRVTARQNVQVALEINDVPGRGVKASRQGTASG